MLATATVLVTLPATLEYVHEGETYPLAKGPLSLALVTVPLGEDSDTWLLLAVAGVGDATAFELPLASSTRILAQPEGYLIPVTDLSPSYLPSSLGTDSGTGFVKVQLDEKASSEDKESFANILWGATAFSSSGATSSSAPYVEREAKELRKKLVLVDRETGALVGELDSPLVDMLDLSTIEADEDDAASIKEPVILDLTPSSGPQIRSLSSVFRETSWRPTSNPTNSTVITVADYLARGITQSSELLGYGLEEGGNFLVDKTKPTTKPLVFSQKHKSNIKASHNLTEGAFKVSSTTIKIIGDAAAKLGDVMGKSMGIQSKPGGAPPVGYRGVLNRSLIAFNAITDSLEGSAKILLSSGEKTSTAVIGHTLGPDAAAMSYSVGSSFKHVVLVYIDARGITRKALLKSVGSSAVSAKLADGRDIVISEDGVAQLAAQGRQDVLEKRDEKAKVGKSD